MQLKLSNSLLRKLVISITIVNIFLLLAYVFLILSESVSNYFLFVLSIPAYLLSKSWILMIGVFGFEGLLLYYYWIKSAAKKASPPPGPLVTEDASELFDIDFLDDIPEENIFCEEKNRLVNQLNTSMLPTTQPTMNATVYHEKRNEEKKIEAENSEKFIVDYEFDRLWEEAIEHVRNATSKKKTLESVGLMENDFSNVSHHTKIPKLNYNNMLKKQGLGQDIVSENTSRALIPKTNLKAKKASSNPSVIKAEHKEFYNEIALNNWIYLNSSDRDRVGIFKLALNETRFREKDLQYLLDAGILFNLLIPLPDGPISIYSIYEGEDKKIILNFLTKICKKNNLQLHQKSIAFTDYQELGLDRKNWRFDFYIDDAIIGLIWISNFLVEEDLEEGCTLAFKNKKELKALLATTKVVLSATPQKAMIIIDYSHNAQMIHIFMAQIGYGSADILAIGEQDFEKQFLDKVKNKISV